MSLLDYFSVRKRMNELEAVLTEIIDEQDELRTRIEHVHSITRGLKGAAARNKAPEPVTECDPNVVRCTGDGATDAVSMTEDEFFEQYQMTPKQFAQQKIRTGEWI